MAQRRRWPVRLTDEARAGYDRICLAHGLTETALAEAIGLAFATGKLKPSAEVIREARRIDVERRSRR